MRKSLVARIGLVSLLAVAGCDRNPAGPNEKSVDHTVIESNSKTAYLDINNILETEEVAGKIERLNTRYDSKEGNMQITPVYLKDDAGKIVTTEGYMVIDAVQITFR
ncbi:MAG: hypothetical protein Q8P81_00015 [Nanoarchaeota archaeon]|nr:hypothetical protein [Nanoarchaeota archaeon]